jgi:hypothetical protein
MLLVQYLQLQAGLLMPTPTLLLWHSVLVPTGNVHGTSTYTSYCPFARLRLSQQLYS